ncbi:MAG: hypothetical protein PUC65_08345 [Clostridiales bacterium]|nr:hypothetical protein [Clostridiales bacterium]
MTQATYQALEEAKVIKSHRCTKEQYYESDPMLRSPGDGYYIYDEIEDEDDLKLLLQIKQIGNTRAIKMMLTYFTVISVLGLLYSLFALLQK